LKVRVGQRNYDLANLSNGLSSPLSAAFIAFRYSVLASTKLVVPHVNTGCLKIFSITISAGVNELLYCNTAGS
jgi:hypothetical protein